MQQSSRFEENTNVFYVTSWGHSGDHWFSKALNAHPEIFVLNSYEGVRAKYFKGEFNRGTRPDILAYTAFLEDMGTDFEAIGECHAYKAHEMCPVQRKYGPAVPIINLLRHPYTWLDFYVRHRVNNLRMPEDSKEAWLHEWNCSRHEMFKELGLKEYRQEETGIWASFQGCFVLNGILLDMETGIRQVRIEEILESPEYFNEVVDYLTKSKCRFSEELLLTVYDFANKIYKGEETRADPKAVYEKWPKWKREGFEKIVKPEAVEAYRRAGYEL